MSRHHDDCGPDCDREFEDMLRDVHAQARQDLATWGAFVRDLGEHLDTERWRGIVPGHPRECEG